MIINTRCRLFSNKIRFTKYENDNKNTKMEKKEYILITNNIINIYNIVAVIALLKEFGLNYEQINTSLAKLK